MHARVIITEAGGTVAVPFLVLAQTQRDAVRRPSARCVRSSPPASRQFVRHHGSVDMVSQHNHVEVTRWNR